jgi:hypothetical protein
MEQFGRNKWKFTRAMIEDAPITRGVYALWENEQLVCLGRADGGERNIRSCLLEQLEGAQGTQARHATHYSWEICVDPAAREAALLKQAQGTREPPQGSANAGVTDLGDYRRQA